MKGIQGRYVRLATGFLLRDVRFLRLSDSAQMLTITVYALALEERREFLPAEYIVDELAEFRRRQVEVLTESLDEILTASRPLLGRLEDGRIRAIGVRDKHGVRTTWRDERKEARLWNLERKDRPGQKVRVTDFAAVTVQGRPAKGAKEAKEAKAPSSRRKRRRKDRKMSENDPFRAEKDRSRLNNDRGTTSAHPEVDSEAEADSKSPPNPPAPAADRPAVDKLTSLRDPSLIEAASVGVSGILRTWGSLNGFRRVGDLDANLRKRLEEDPKRVLAHVHEVHTTTKEADRGKLWTRLYARLGRNWATFEPNDTRAWPFAREVMSGNDRDRAEGKEEGDKGPEHLAQAARRALQKQGCDVPGGSSAQRGSG